MGSATGESAQACASTAGDRLTHVLLPFFAHDSGDILTLLESEREARRLR